VRLLVLVARGQGDSEQVKMSLRLKRYGLVDRESRSHAATTDGGRLPRYVHAVSGASRCVAAEREPAWRRSATSATGSCAEGRFELQQVSKDVAVCAEKWCTLFTTQDFLCAGTLAEGLQEGHTVLGPDPETHKEPRRACVRYTRTTI
jgi:hypothetical protein